MSTNSIAVSRLTEERKQWRKDHPFGFIAKPSTNPDGSANLLQWECAVPGKTGTLWEGGLYRVLIKFSDSYPAAAPECIFTPPIPHPNVWTTGKICLSIISYGWKPAITVKQILLGIQELMSEPNLKSPANGGMYELYRGNRKEYDNSVRAFAARFKAQ